jgi:hypothetical protein
MSSLPLLEPDIPGWKSSLPGGHDKSAIVTCSRESYGSGVAGEGERELAAAEDDDWANEESMEKAVASSARERSLSRATSA